MHTPTHTPIQRNTLFYGDNLDILREYIATESVDLVYLDPPFNSSRTYNVLFKNEGGTESDAQIAAFDDTWHWGMSAETAYTELITQGTPEVATMIAAMRSFIGTNQMMAYLVMMAIRLVELHRVLKPTGSLYLHCDPTASHYLKVILDTVFGPDRFLSEIIWKRTSAHNTARRPGPVHDVLLLYAKSDQYTWIPQYQPYDQDYIDSFYRYTDSDGRRYQVDNLTGAGIRHGETGNPWRGINPTEKGRHWAVPPSVLDEMDAKGLIYWPPKGVMPRQKRYLDQMQGVSIQDVWSDIKPIGSQAAERLGYPTQKPEALLERIVQASSNPGDLVLDPFCGCGTTIAAAQKLGRRWVGIDITHLSIALQKYRLRDAFTITAGEEYDVIGEPISLDGAAQLAQEDRYQFQWWALSLIQARPVGGAAGGKKGKKGADQGIDGVINFIDDNTGKAKQTIVQVKSGKVGSRDIRDLVGTLKRENAAIGVFVTLEEPSGPMLTEAASAGFYDSQGWAASYPKVQILTIKNLLAGAQVQMPPSSITFSQAPKQMGKDQSRQPGLFG